VSSARPISGSVAHLDPVQHARVEHVDTGVDPVSDELDRLLDESVNNRAVRLGHNDTVRRRLGHLGNHDRALVSVRDVEVAVVS